jgi:hypothetical protein
MMTIQEHLSRKIPDILYLYHLAARISLIYSRAPDRMVTFEVGDDDSREIFLLHKEVACRGSMVFEKAFNSDFIEGQTQTYRLHDIDPNTFRFFSEWLYSQKLTLLKHRSLDAMTESERAEHVVKCVAQDRILVGLWVLGDRFCVTKLQDSVIRHMMKISGTCGLMTASCINDIYENTMPGSQLRRMAVNQRAWKAGSSELVKEGESLPHEMLVDLITLYSGAVHRADKQEKAAGMKPEDFFVTARNATS